MKAATILCLASLVFAAPVPDPKLGDILRGAGDVIWNVADAGGAVLDGSGDIVENVTEAGADVLSGTGTVLGKVADAGGNALESAGALAGTIADAEGAVVDSVAEALAAGIPEGCEFLGESVVDRHPLFLEQA